MVVNPSNWPTFPAGAVDVTLNCCQGLSKVWDRSFPRGIKLILCVDDQQCVVHFASSPFGVPLFDVAIAHRTPKTVLNTIIDDGLVHVL